jgi:hypothetical protein
MMPPMLTEITARSATYLIVSLMIFAIPTGAVHASMMLGSPIGMGVMSDPEAAETITRGESDKKAIIMTRRADRDIQDYLRIQSTS